MLTAAGRASPWAGGTRSCLPPFPHLLDAARLLGTALQLPPQLLALPLEPLVLPQDGVCPGQAAAGRHRLGAHQRLHARRTQRARTQRQERGRHRGGQHPAGSRERLSRFGRVGELAAAPASHQTHAAVSKSPQRRWKCLSCYLELGSAHSPTKNPILQVCLDLTPPGPGSQPPRPLSSWECCRQPGIGYTLEVSIFLICWTKQGLLT